MILRVPYIFPGIVKSTSSRGNSTEIILVMGESAIEISSLIPTNSINDLALKKGAPAYAVIVWMKGASSSGSDKKMVTVQAGNGTWVTILRGSATEEQIREQRKKDEINHSKPSAAQEKAWSYGYLTISEFIEATQKILLDFGGCAPGSSVLQIETIRYPDGTWVTIPYSPECEAKVLNAKEKFKNSSQKPSSSLLEAWSHGYSSDRTFSEAPGSANGFRVNGPTLAGFVYTGQNEKPNLFISSGPSIGENAWPVPVNIYHGPDKIGQAQVANIKN